MQTQSHIEAVQSRLRSALKRGAVANDQLVAQCGVPLPTLRMMARPNWRPRSIENLIAVERALADEPGASPVAPDTEASQ